MYFYKLGYWTNDGSAGVELWHNDVVTKEALERMVFEATAEVIRRERQNRSHFPFSWIYDEVATVLVMRHGFKRVEFTADYEVYGSGSVLDPEEEMHDLDKLHRYLKSVDLTS